MSRLGAAAREDAACYLVGGGTAVLLGWRDTTVDVDIRLEPESADLLRQLAALKDDLEVNVELASPADFIPLPDGWRERSPFVAQEGKIVFRHFDLLSQALAKLERDHQRDRADLQAMLDAGLVERERLLEAFDRDRSRAVPLPGDRSSPLSCASRGSSPVTHEVKLSSADRVLFPDEASRRATSSTTTARSRPAILPHLRDRPFTMKRWREGLAGGSFFQKQAPKGMPDWIPTRQFRTMAARGRGRGSSTSRSSTRARRCSGWCRCTAST